ncbi:mannose-6-phosphate isomerase, class I [Rhodococcus sp. AD45-ID]|uniref:mannose-6-phosphate isomerase, class I n=1 Tax=unclassified Rhodococcus (in: high G+C Gram-positive bacteria) TaxID=192944 RepID=UPI0005D3B484|nr:MULTISPECIES: mannose-6-phosphate isomerase, class I [unclassified Rhodococcus (in: high G+C Gram-positive bacteria)]KJF23475.1 Mannose-6-phosphate isomerase [Rhodococcus sp. AD45]PSR41909.1 mannose-6-phosphate isomerase, class I [Rhodococcus sp. AD45-ID]
MELITGVIKSYDWGSRRTLAELAGRPSPSPTPEAELWFGAHESAPSAVGEPSGSITLIDRIREDPQTQLGAQCAEAYDGTLPFLLKILAAEKPLSLQAHPTSAQAEAGFARENAAGIDLAASYRNYRDSRHKPELVVALKRFEALAGFRDISSTVTLLTALDLSGVADDIASLAANPCPAELKAVALRWMRSSREHHDRLALEVIERATALLDSGGRAVDRFEAELSTALDLARRYPGDPGVLMSLLLNRVSLAPGEGLFLPAGNLHAYLSGSAVEIMANSDNVLRGGLTTKHIDVDELSSILDFTPIPVDVLDPEPSDRGSEYIYPAPVPEFVLRRWELDGNLEVALGGDGPAVVLCTAGRVKIRAGDHQMEISGGEAVWLQAGDSVTMTATDGGPAQVFAGATPG